MAADEIWSQIRVDDEILVVVLRAAGDRAFSVGLDVTEGLGPPGQPVKRPGPGEDLSPKQGRRP